VQAEQEEWQGFKNRFTYLMPTIAATGKVSILIVIVAVASVWGTTLV
jgi:hypothetical protein